MANITQKVQIDNSQIITRLMEIKKIKNSELAKASGMSTNWLRKIKKRKDKLFKRDEAFNH